MKIRKMKSNLDERQELKLLKIEHNGCWIAFWGLLIVMAIQMIVGNDSIKNLAGEGAVLMSLAFYLLVACIRNGIWDRRLKPNLLVVGCFMDITPAVLIFTPIFLPVVQSFGMDPIHFGIMMVMNLGIGNITPPVGSALFSGCSVADMDMEDMIKPILPFYAAIFVALMLVAYVPWFSMALPTLFGAV